MKKKVEFENIAALLVGLWVMLLPLFVERIDNYPGAHVYLWNFFFVGLTVVAMSLVVMKKLVAWAEILNIIAGTWLLLSPLFLIYFTRSNVLYWNSVICGSLIAFFSALSLPFVSSVIYHKHKKTDETPILVNPHQRTHI